MKIAVALLRMTVRMTGNVSNFSSARVSISGVTIFWCRLRNCELRNKNSLILNVKSLLNEKLWETHRILAEKSSLV